jgi:2-keto-4-pentenoate hydratase/2-oxohepta-3-ene-1,7-dioic acid hydratase in catechol pathway
MRVARLKSSDLAIVRGDTLIPVGEALVRAGVLRGPSMLDFIANYAAIEPRLGDLIQRGQTVPLDFDALAVPVDRPSKIWAAASNYRRGSAAAGDQVGRGEAPTASAEAILETAFLKPPSALIGPRQAVVIPPGAGTIFPELELCAVIGRKVSNITPEEALDAVFGYTIILDITARDFGAAQSLVATRCVRKGFDTFAPLGPWLVTRDEIADPQRLTMRLAVNGDTVQHASTSAMLNDVATLVSYLSRVSTLYPGDLIATGNPDAPAFQQQLVPGDRLAAEIEGIGVLEVTVAR